jgi:hypothetical protein
MFYKFLSLDHDHDRVENIDNDNNHYGNLFREDVLPVLNNLLESSVSYVCPSVRLKASRGCMEYKRGRAFFYRNFRQTTNVAPRFPDAASLST